jgi:predicted RNA-binding protein YlqC (UPF0109 family)
MTRAVVEYVTPWLVDSPDEVEITEVESEGGTTIIEVSVAPDDVGKIIGKRGRIIHSVRILARAAAQREGTNIMVEVVD